ncbi:MAG: cytochrome c biogenesis protein CcsA [Deltaproteobacteria bacterium]|nr:cytochrome c biogenesis protein CcsA [Deltaproteobacteria bacterium]
MRFLEGIFLWSAIAFYLFSFLFFLSSIVFKKERQLHRAWVGSVIGLGLHTLAILVRWIASGHPPVYGSFEHAFAGSWFIMVIFFIISGRFKQLKAAGAIVAPFVLLMLGYGIMGQRLDIEPLTPPYQSNWLWVHVTFAWIAYGSYHVAAGLAIMYLLKERALRTMKTGERLSRLYQFFPDLPVLDDLIFKLIVYGFIAHIVMLGAGALWAYGLWGRYWAWDPIETWSLITWLVYGVNIHLRVTYQWNGARGAWLAIISLIGILITFGGIGFVGGVHTPLL